MLSKAYGMSCPSWTSGNVAAQGLNIVVAEVSFLKYDPTTSVSKLKIKKVYIGDSALKTISLLGDSPLYGSASNQASTFVEPWIGIFAFEGSKVAPNTIFSRLGCSEDHFSINKSGKIMVGVSEVSSIELSEPEFEDYINLKAVPTLNSYSCNVLVYDNGAIEANEPVILSGSASESFLIKPSLNSFETISLDLPTKDKDVNLTCSGIYGMPLIYN